ncbi:hypothetical protein [Neisseria sp. Ec49-e6-T10]|uniref:hypothetical protein n=1 Tax=Neisseria sp. Ec49-e6-T10 TaxID=3140744 RepID=UPI003EBE40DF
MQKKLLVKLILLLPTLVISEAYADRPGSYMDNNSGCRLVLCLVNPGEGMKSSDCKKDVREMYKQLASKRPFVPSCKEAEAEGTGYKLRKDHYQICPNGMKDTRTMGKIEYLMKNGIPLNEKNVLASRYNPAPGSGGYVVADGNRPILMNTSNQPPYTALACVPKSETPVISRFCLEKEIRGECTQWVKVHRFNNITWLPYRKSPAVVDSYVNHKLSLRSRLYGEEVCNDDTNRIYQTNRACE